MIEALVKPTVQKKASVQACCGYSVHMFLFEKGFQGKALAPIKLTVVSALRRCNDVSRGWHGIWSSTASRQAECDRLNRWWRPINRCFMLFSKKHVTAMSGSLAYIRPHPRSFGVAGVREKLPTL
jgi:hypothetical protein